MTASNISRRCVKKKTRETFRINLTFPQCVVLERLLNRYYNWLIKLSRRKRNARDPNWTKVSSEELADLMHILSKLLWSSHVANYDYVKAMGPEYEARWEDEPYPDPELLIRSKAR